MLLTGLAIELSRHHDGLRRIALGGMRGPSVKVGTHLRKGVWDLSWPSTADSLCTAAHPSGTNGSDSTTGTDKNNE